MKTNIQSIPDSIIVTDQNGKHRIASDDSIFNMSVNDFMEWLRNSHEFRDNPTKETMEKVLGEYVSWQIQTLRQDSSWYIREAMPVFLKNIFQRKIKELPHAHS